MDASKKIKQKLLTYGYYSIVLYCSWQFHVLRKNDSGYRVQGSSLNFQLFNILHPASGICILL